MSTLYVTEYSGAASGGRNQVVHGRRLRKNNVAIGAASAASNPFSTNTYLVRLKCDAACSFVFSPENGVVPTATNTDEYFAAGDGEYFEVTPGDVVAVIQNP